jgi:melibiose permease/lactose/raffinose/galactose permease
MYLSFGYNGMNVTLFVAAYALASVTVNAAYPKIARRISRNKMAFWALLTTITGYLMFLCTGFFIPLHIYILCIWAFVIGFGQTLFYMVTTICLTNTIEYNEYKTGRRDEAIIFSLRPFMAKMSSALQQVILTLVYLIIGMTDVTNGISEIENKVNLKQMDEALKEGAIADVLSSAPPSMAIALRVCMVILPVLLISAAYFFMRRKVKIDEDEYKRMLAEIAGRKGEKNQ